MSISPLPIFDGQVQTQAIDMVTTALENLFVTSEEPKQWAIAVCISYLVGKEIAFPILEVEPLKVAWLSPEELQMIHKHVTQVTQQLI